MIEYLPDSMAAGISKEYRKGGEVKALMGNEPTPSIRTKVNSLNPSFV
jgi:hypothetical protein